MIGASKIPKMTDKVWGKREIWSRIFETNQGCPAHLYPDKTGSFCQDGYCCSSCPQKTKKVCPKKSICNGNPNTCSAGKITIFELRRIYSSKRWRDFGEFLREVEIYVRKYR